MIKYEKFRFPASGSTQAQATNEIRGYFIGPDRDNPLRAAPVQVAALLDGLIQSTRMIADAAEAKKPFFSFSDPGDDFGRIKREALRFNQIFRSMRTIVGEVREGAFDPDAIWENISAPLFYGDWSFYKDNDLRLPLGARLSDKLPLVGWPWNVANQLGVAMGFQQNIAAQWATEDLPEAVEEGLQNVGETVGQATGAIASGVGSAAGNLGAGTIKGLFRGLGPVFGPAVGITGGLFLWLKVLRPMYRELKKEIES